MSRDLTKYVDDIKIMVVCFHPGTYDVHVAPAGTYEGAVVFTSCRKAKAVAVSEYLATLSRDLLKEMINERRKEIEA
jgi:hypothetical protein